MVYIITLLTSKALNWASAFWDLQSLTTDSSSFIAETILLAQVMLITVCFNSQGTRSMAEFAIEFFTLAIESRWDQRALWATFHQALSPKLKDELVFRDPRPDLESLNDV